MSDGDMTGRVVIVTGGAQGQGAAEAAVFAEYGADVVIADVDPAGADVARSSPRCSFEEHDVSDQNSWNTLVAATLSRFGRIDVLINNAGVVGPGSIADFDLEVYQRAIAVNQTGPLLGMLSVAPHMHSGGSVVNVCSTAASTGVRGIIPYVASKWALRGMTKSVAIELADQGIRVNAILPGRIDTALLSEAVEDTANAALRIPLGRVGRTWEVARLAHFLGSDLSSFCTGADFVVDGGHTAQLP